MLWNISALPMNSQWPKSKEPRTYMLMHTHILMLLQSVHRYMPMLFISCIHMQFNRTKDAFVNKIRWRRRREASRGHTISEWWPTIEPLWCGHQKTPSEAAPTGLQGRRTLARPPCLPCRHPRNTASPSCSPRSHAVNCRSRSICCHGWPCKHRTLNIKMRKV
jgi:hypothetical protein